MMTATAMKGKKEKKKMLPKEMKLVFAFTLFDSIFNFDRISRQHVETPKFHLAIRSLPFAPDG